MGTTSSGEGHREEAPDGVEAGPSAAGGVGPRRSTSGRAPRWPLPRVLMPVLGRIEAHVRVIGQAVVPLVPAQAAKVPTARTAAGATGAAPDIAYVGAVVVRRPMPRSPVDRVGPHGRVEEFPNTGPAPRVANTETGPFIITPGVIPPVGEKAVVAPRPTAGASGPSRPKRRPRVTTPAAGRARGSSSERPDPSRRKAPFGTDRRPALRPGGTMGRPSPASGPACAARARAQIASVCVMALVASSLAVGRRPHLALVSSDLRE